MRVTCKGCGVVFTPKSKKQKYHSEDCRKAYYDKTYYAKTYTDKTCPNCGIVYSSSAPSKQVYCSPKCREDARIKRRDAAAVSRSTEKVTYLKERVSTFERDGFKCTVCGRGPKDGIVLDVVEEDTQLRTVCSDCKTGKEITNDTKD